MKKILGLFLLYLFLSGCYKSYNEKDTLVQYFQCVIDDTNPIMLTEDELTHIYPSYSIAYHSDINRVTYYIN